MISLQIYSLFSVSLVLYFDGSLKIPKDPNNDVIPTRVSSALSPLATCSTSVIHEKNNSIVALGSSNIPYDGLITSADIEYEGLLLGLNCLLKMCESKRASIQNSEVIIRGDCKTVIDQMNGDSLPRKQKSYYNKAFLMRRKLETEHEVSIYFQHVTRDQNVLCDGMCKVILQHLQRYATENVLNSIRHIEKDYHPFRLPDNRKKRFAFIETPFYKPLNEIALWSGHVPISLRPYIMCEMLLASSRTGDLVAMRLVGTAMYKESLRLYKNRIDLKCADVVNDLGLVGMKATYTSLVEMEIHREADKIAKHISHKYGAANVGFVTEQNLHTLQCRLPVPDKSDEKNRLVMESISSGDQIERLKEWEDNISKQILSEGYAQSPFFFFT